MDTLTKEPGQPEKLDFDVLLEWRCRNSTSEVIISIRPSGGTAGYRVYPYRVIYARSGDSITITVTSSDGQSKTKLVTVPSPPSSLDCNGNNPNPDSSPIYGCTDPSASNYNSSANTDDGSCTYPVYGCTDPAAENYNPSAVVDDGSCTYPPPSITEITYACWDGIDNDGDGFVDLEDPNCNNRNDNDEGK